MMPVPVGMAGIIVAGPFREIKHNLIGEFFNIQFGGVCHPYLRGKNGFLDISQLDKKAKFFERDNRVIRKPAPRPSKKLAFNKG